MEAVDILKIIGGALVGAIISRVFKASDSVDDIKIRQAILSEKVDRLQEKVTILERNEKSVWVSIDKLKGKQKCAP